MSKHVATGVAASITVGPVSIELSGIHLTRKDITRLMRDAAGITAALMTDDETTVDEQPFGFAPVAAQVEQSAPVRDDRWDWVWGDDE